MPSRVLQLIHEPTILGKREEDMIQNLAKLKDQGVGGIVTNVSFTDYFENKDKWSEFLALIRACRKQEMRVWLYDEKSYPSGTAGGRVLKADPSLEALALARDNGRVFEERAYEGTHAAHNYHARRRYVNLLDPAATAKFLEVTHQEYQDRLRDVLWPVEAFFTDEPAINALNVGALEPEVEAQLAIHDPIDPNKRIPARVPWSRDLADQFNDEERQALFVDGPRSATVRRTFYHAVADRVSGHFFGQIQTWCRNHGTLSSGHLLSEEYILTHPLLYGNALRCILKFDIPGIDILNASPAAGVEQNLRAAVLAASAAMLNGTRRIMTEVSDLVQLMHQHRLATVPEAQATAAWQAALGVTDFTSYYVWGDLDILPHPVTIPNCEIKRRTPDEYRAINAFTNNLVDQLATARLTPDVFLYYPIELIQEQYVPSGLPIRQIPFSPRILQIRDAFDRAVDELVRAGVCVCLVDGPMIRSAVRKEGRIQIMNARANAIVYPVSCPPPPDLLPPADCPAHEMTPDTPKALFHAGRSRLWNTQPEVFATALDAETDHLFVAVNLIDQPRTYELHVPGGIESGVLKGYEAAVLRRSKK